MFVNDLNPEVLSDWWRMKYWYIPIGMINPEKEQSLGIAKGKIKEISEGGCVVTKRFMERGGFK